LHQDRAHWLCRNWPHLSGLTIELLQRFPPHPQLHLRIFLEDLCVSLTKHLSHPFVRDSSRTQPRGIRGPEVVEPEVRNPGSAKSSAPNPLETGLVPVRVPIARK